MLQEISVDIIDHNNDFRLQNQAQISDLAQSLSIHGQLSPIGIRENSSKPGFFQVVFGNRRLEAAKSLGWKSIKANLIEADDKTALVLAIVENLDRKDLSDYEKALFLEKLHSITGKTYAEIAQMIGKSASFVSLHIAMLHLFPKSMGTESERDKILHSLTEKHARVLSKLDKVEDRWDTAKFALSANLSVRELERICARPSNSLAYANRPGRSRSIQEIIRDFTTGFNRKDLRPFFESFSNRKFTIFTSYPPFSKLDNGTAMDYLCDSFRHMGEVYETLDDVDIRVCGKFAYVTMTVLFEIKQEGKLVKSKTRSTLILEKEKQAGWKIVHAHYSTANPEVFLDLFPGHVEEKKSRLTGHASNHH